MTVEESEEFLRIVDAGVRRAAAKALLRHKTQGIPIYVWRDGKVTRIPPEEIEVPEIIEPDPHPTRST